MKQKINLRELKFKRLRFRRIRFRVLMIILGLAATFLIGFNFWFIEHAENTLESIVESQSGGKIKLKVEKFHFNWITNQIKLEKAALYTNNDSATNMSYLFSAPAINIKATGFLPLLFKRILIDSIHIYQPAVIVTKLHEAPQAYTHKHTARSGDFSVAKEIGRISQSVNKAINVLHISRFILDDGSFSLIDKTKPKEIPFNVNKINILLDNLQVDSATTRGMNQRITFTDEISLQTSDQDMIFPGNTHFLSFKNFRVTLRDRRVEFDSCTIRAIKGDSSKTAFNIFFDQLKLTNIDFDALYKSELIKADSVFCKNPSVFLDIDNTKKDKTVSSRKDVKKLDEVLQQLMGDIMLNYVVVQNAGLNITTYTQGKTNLFASKNNNIEIQGLAVRQNQERPVTINKFVMSLFNYKTLLQNGRYSFAFDTLLFNDNEVNLNKFAFEEFKDGKRIKSLEMPRFALRGFSWESLLYDNYIAAESARFYNPRITFTALPSKQKKQKNIFQTLNSVGNAMKLSNLEIINGDIKILMDKGARLHLQNTDLSLRANELTASRKIKNIQHAVKNLYTRRAQFSSGTANIRLDNLRLSDDKAGISAASILLRSTGVSARANGIKIYSIVLDSGSSNVVMNGLRWNNATIAINAKQKNNKKQTRQTTTGLVFSAIRGSNTQIRSINNDKKISAYLSSIRVDKILQKTGRPEIYGLNVSGRDFLLTDPVQTLSIKNLSISDNHNSILSNISYHKIDAIDSIAASIPKVTIIPNISQIVNGNIFVNSVVVHDPVIKARIGKKDNKNAGGKKQPEISIGEAKLERPDILLTFTNADALPSRVEWNGVKANSYIHVHGLKSTAQAPVSADEVKIYLTNFDYINAKNKRIATNDNKLNLLFKDFLLQKNDSGKAEWKTTANILSIDKLMFDSLGKNNAILRMDNGDVRNISLNSKFPKVADIIKNSDNLHITGTDGSLVSERNSMYWYNLSFNKGFFKTDSFYLEPRQSLEDYKIAKKFNAGYLTLRSGLITGGPFNLEKYGSDSILSIGRIEANDLFMYTFKDKTQPDTVKKYKPLPTAMIKNISSKLDIGRLDLKNMNILHEELSNKTLALAKIPVTDLNAAIENIKNHNIQPQDSLWVNASMKVLGDLPLYARIRESYYDSLNAFVLNARGGSVPLEAFNRILIPFIGAKAASGYLDSLTMTATGNEYYSKGQMQMYYNGLKLQLLNKKDLPNQNFFNKVVSWLANLLIVRKNNNGKVAPVFFERDKEKSAINFYIKTAVSGLKSSVGLPGAKRQEKRYFRRAKKMGN